MTSRSSDGSWQRTGGHPEALKTTARDSAICNPNFSGDMCSAVQLFHCLERSLVRIDAGAVPDFYAQLISKGAIDQIVCGSDSQGWNPADPGLREEVRCFSSHVSPTDRQYKKLNKTVRIPVARTHTCYNCSNLVKNVEIFLLKASDPMVISLFERWPSGGSGDQIAS
jgi:hypothetical protein